MYADRYAKPAGLRAGSLALALGVNGVIMGALIFFSAPTIGRHIETILEGRNIPIEVPPPPPTEQHKKQPPKALVAKPYEAPKPLYLDPIVPPDTSKGLTIDLGTKPYTGTPQGTGTGGVTIDPVKLPPVIVGPQIDTRFAGAFQPAYPADERRAGNQGRVVVRVLIGVDGRVKQVEKIAASSDSFFEVTRRRALEKWRFTPGTQDGIPVESWRTMNVSFVLNED